MFTVNDAGCTNQFETAKKQRIKQWTNGYFIKMDLSATVTGVSNFVEENVYRPGGLSHSLLKHNRLNMSIAMHLACS